jgi:ABC-type xylose transport system permease subunit
MTSASLVAAFPRRSAIFRLFEAYGQEFVVLGAIIVLFIGVGLYNPRFLNDTNLTSIFSGNAYIAVAAIGMSRSAR